MVDFSKDTIDFFYSHNPKYLGVYYIGDKNPCFEVGLATEYSTVFSSCSSLYFIPDETINTGNVMHYYNEEITNNITQEISSRFNIRSINELSKSIDTEILTNIFKNTDTNEK
jgi:hypothetical protein